MNKLTYVILSLICIILIPAAYANTWSNQTITISITDNEYLTQERLDHIQYTITSTKEKNDRFAGWNHALNGTLSLVLVEDDGDIQVTLVNYKSTRIYSAYTTLDSNYPRTISAADITIFDIESLSNHEIQMLMRHEIGHALGLEHFKDSTDLMHPVIPYHTSYISQSNMDKIKSFYG